MKLLAVLSIGLLSYGGLEVYISNLDMKHIDTRSWCNAGMCPEEFPALRIYDLLSKSTTDKPEEALVDLRRALLANSASAYNWANLGDAEMNAKHVDTARYCFQQAVADAPRNPLILFRAANFDFQAGDFKGTLGLLKTVLNLGGSNYYEPAFLTYSRIDLPIQDILEAGMPKNQNVAGQYLKFWITSNKVSEAQATWSWMTQKGIANTQLASEYVSFLMNNKAFDLAASTWKEAEKRDVPEYRNTNWVFDGNFRQEPTQSPLDWNISKVQGVEIQRTPDGARDGKSALQVNFLGTDNVDFQNVSQTVILRPGQWSFKAWVKTDSLTTNQGIAVRVGDLTNGRTLNWVSRALVGSNDWTCLEETFAIPDDSTPIRIEFVRQPSRKFDNKIRGTVTIDSVTVAPL